MVAIPAIANDLQADAVLVSWIPTAFLLTTVVLMLPFGKLSDMYGRKRTFLRGMVIMCIASALAALSRDIYWLLGCRILQGIAAAQTMGTAMAIVTSIFPKEKRGAALGLTATAVYVGLTSGPLLGGLVTEYFGWRSVFLMHLPLAALVVVLTIWKLKGDWKSDVKPSFDYTGSVLFACWAITILLALSAMPSWKGISLFALSAGFGYLFFYHQNRIEQPLVRLSALKANKLFSHSLISAFFLYSATFPTTFLLSLYLQYIKDIPPAVAGRFLIVQAVIMAIISPISGRLSDKYDPRLLTGFGSLVVAVGFALLMQINFDTPTYRVVISQALFGIGFGFFTTPNNNSAMGSLKTSNLGMSSAILNLSRTLGNMIGMGIVMMLIAIRMSGEVISPSNYDDLLSAISMALSLSFCYALIAAFFSFRRGGPVN